MCIKKPVSYPPHISFCHLHTSGYTMLRTANNPVMAADLNHQRRIWNILTRKNLVCSYALYPGSSKNAAWHVYLKQKRVELFPRWRTAFLLKYSLLFGSKKLRKLENLSQNSTSEGKYVAEKRWCELGKFVSSMRKEWKKEIRWKKRNLRSS